MISNKLSQLRFLIIKQKKKQTKIKLDSINLISLIVSFSCLLLITTINLIDLTNCLD